MKTLLPSKMAERMEVLQKPSGPQRYLPHVGIVRLAVAPKSGSILPLKHQLQAISESALPLPMTRTNLFQNSTKYVSFMLKLLFLKKLEARISYTCGQKLYLECWVLQQTKDTLKECSLMQFGIRKSLWLSRSLKCLIFLYNPPKRQSSGFCFLQEKHLRDAFNPN